MVLKHKIRKCPDCGIVFEGGNAGKALAGHVWLKHHRRIGYKAELEGEVARLKGRVNELIAQCSSQEIKLKQANTEVAKVRDSLGTCYYCHNPLGNILYHELVEGNVKLDGKRVVAFKCKS